MTTKGEPSSSFSVSAKAYERIEDGARRLGISVSSLVEIAVAPALGIKPARATVFRRRFRRDRDAT